MPEKISKSTIYNNLLNAFKIQFAKDKLINPSEIQIREGDIIKSILESVSSELFIRYLEILDYYNSFSIYNNTGEELDLRAKDFNMTRNPSTKAYGFGVFSLNPAALKDYTIDLKNTIVSNIDGSKTYRFVIDSTSQPYITIASGSSYSDLLRIESTDAGLKYNAEINEIQTIQTLSIFPDLSGSEITFSNTTAVIGGSDTEEDESFRNRILLKMSGINKGTYDYFINLALNFSPSNSNNKIISASIKEAFMDNYSKLYIYTSRSNPDSAIMPFSGSDVITDNYLLSYKINYVPVISGSILWRQDYLSGADMLTLTPWTSGSTTWDYILNEATGEIVFNGGNNRDVLPSPGLMSGNEIVFSGSYYGGEYNELQLKINDPTERVIGVNLKVLPVDIYVINTITIKIKTISGLNIETLRPDIKRGIDRYINILRPGDDFIKSRLIDFIYDEVGEKVVDLEIVEPQNNIAVNENQKIIYSTLILQAL